MVRAGVVILQPRPGAFLPEPIVGHGFCAGYAMDTAGSIPVRSADERVTAWAEQPKSRTLLFRFDLFLERQEKRKPDRRLGKA